MPADSFSQAIAARKAASNPIVRKTHLNAYPGWVVRRYANGMFDATNGIALTRGVESFALAVAEVRGQQ